jgi:hypothetical protein
MKKTGILSSCALGVLAMMLDASPAQATFWYQLRNVASGQCVNNQSFFTAPPTPGRSSSHAVDEVPCAPSFAQNWSFTPITGKPGQSKVANHYAHSTSIVMQVPDRVPVNAGGHVGFGRGIVVEIWRYGTSSTKVVNGHWAADPDPSNSEWSLTCSGFISTCTLANHETHTCLTAGSSLQPLLTHAPCDGSRRQQYQLLFAGQD